MYNQTPKKYSKEEFDVMMAEAKEKDNATKLQNEEKRAEYKELMVLAKKVYSHNSRYAGNRNQRVISYLSKNLPDNADTNHNVRNLEEIIRKQKELEKKETEENYKKECEVKKFALALEAVEWLKNKGIVPDLFDPISQANKVSYEEEVAKMEERGRNGEIFDFDGHNCSDYGDRECSGWGGVDRRCECGNRRCYWAESDYHSFKEPCVVATAY